MSDTPQAPQTPPVPPVSPAPQTSLQKPPKKWEFPKISFDIFQWNETVLARALIIFLVFLGVLSLHETRILQRFELVTYDYRCRLRPVQATDPRIVVIEISDDSVAKIGRWPWDREWHASLIKILDSLGAKAVVFDVIFSEESNAKSDTDLADAIRAAQKVYLAEVVQDAPGNKREVLTSLSKFTDNVKGSGHINLQPDIDGVMRRIPLIAEVNGVKIPQLSFAVAMDLYGAKLQDIQCTNSSITIPVVGSSPLTVPLDAKGNMILNWPGRWQETFKHYSYIDVIGSYALMKKGKAPIIPLTEFKDKICYIGTSASGLFDIRPTPLQPLYPAVGVNLIVLDNLLKKHFVRELSFSYNLLILLLLSVCLFFITHAQSYFRNVSLTLTLLVLYLGFAAAMFYYWGIWVSVVYPTVLIFLAFFFITLYNQMAITIERQKLLKMATRDSLTGLYNVGQFKLLLRAELSTLAIRHNDRTMSILMTDADNFKHTNDTYGHPMGDQVLREVANVMRTTCRALDVAARYGGEEFILMLPGASAEDAFKVAEKIRIAISQKVFHHEKGDFSKTISIGIAQARNGEKDIEAFVERADKALYEAKHTGKNKAVIYK